LPTTSSFRGYSRRGTNSISPFDSDMARLGGSRSAPAEARSCAKRSHSGVECGSPLSLRRMGVPPPIPCASPARPRLKESGRCAVSWPPSPLETLKKSEAAPPFALGSGESRLYTVHRELAYVPASRRFEFALWFRLRRVSRK
jgi:hypothetical protein